MARHAPDVEVLRLGSMEPSYTPLEHPLRRIVRRAVAIGFGVPPIDVPLLGGSLPDAVFTQRSACPRSWCPTQMPTSGTTRPTRTSRSAASSPVFARQRRSLPTRRRQTARERRRCLERGSVYASHETHRSPQGMLDAVALALEPGTEEASILSVRIEVPSAPASARPGSGDVPRASRARTVPMRV